MFPSIRLAFVACLFSISFCVLAQQPTTVGELLDKGAKMLTKDELVKLITGATVSGIQAARPDVKFEMTMKPDGTLTGGASNIRTGRDYVSLSGTWSINENGQSCSAIKNSFGQTPTGTGNCLYYFHVGDTYYTARSVEREEPANPRQVKR